MPIHNIRAGIAYLLKRLAKFAYQTNSDADTNVCQITVESGDTLEKIVKKKAPRRRVISGWQSISTAVIASRYNRNPDKKYAEKLDYVLKHLRKNG